MDIKVVSIVPGKMLNFQNVTEITKSNGWIFVKREAEVIGILIETNVVAILQNGGVTNDEFSGYSKR